MKRTEAHSIMARPVTLIEATGLFHFLGIPLWLASETFQHTGSFKFRAAYSVASSVSASTLLTASSGNFGQALAYACRLLGKKAIVVMPDSSAKVKVEAVLRHGATVDLIDVRRVSRLDRVRQMALQYPEAYLASAYDDPLVIQGNATLGTELAALEGKVDAILVPIGGGGLASGVLCGLRASGCDVPVLAAEPALANDAAQSWRAGRIVVQNGESSTIADGARSLSLGQHNWEILRTGLAGVLEVSEASIGEAVRLLFQLEHLKAEPTGALALAALLEHREQLNAMRICCVVSGANVDPSLYASILRGEL